MDCLKSFRSFLLTRRGHPFCPVFISFSMLIIMFRPVREQFFQFLKIIHNQPHSSKVNCRNLILCTINMQEGQPGVKANSRSKSRSFIASSKSSLTFPSKLVESFQNKDACVERDPHVGYDPAATQTARQSVKDLLRTVFNMN